MSNKAEKLDKLLDERIDEDIREHLERRDRAGTNTITRAVIDQVFEQTEETLLKDKNQLDEEGSYSTIAFIKRTLRNPELREKFYRRYRC